jgi:hypothetical protein
MRKTLLYIASMSLLPSSQAALAQDVLSIGELDEDEALALGRAVSAHSWLVKHGVSPLKIMINYVSAADFVADNSTPEGRRENQRVEIEVIYVQAY